MRKLTPKQAAFVEEYLVDLNATQAAIRARYSKKTAKDIGCQNLAKLNVQTAIQKLMQERIDKVKIDSEYVLKRLVEIDRMDVADILSDDGSVLPVTEWPKIWRQFIAGFDVSELYKGTGKERLAIGVLKKIKWPDKLKNLELIGKHVDIQAFKEKRDVSSEDGLPVVIVHDPGRIETT